jgi:hypothetical protein
MEAVPTIGLFMSALEHLLYSDVLLSPDISDESVILQACYEGVDDVGIMKLLQLVLVLSEAPYVVMYAFIAISVASQEVLGSVGLSVSPLEVVTKLTLEVSPAHDGTLTQMVQPGPSRIYELNG